MEQRQLKMIACTSGYANHLSMWKVVFSNVEMCAQVLS
jgi:hypothetical protein